MQFKDSDIQHIADLARLELTPAELVSYGSQLSAITAYIDQLQTVTAENVQTPPSLVNVWREDEVRSWDPEENEGALAQGEREAGLIKVKRVL
jgi:aspartyl-tRNA(Asn)/glutamyl-tRNA(Gln) amidotransferase subunit C